jgi:hypothetical protein
MPPFTNNGLSSNKRLPNIYIFQVRNVGNCWGF